MLDDVDAVQGPGRLAPATRHDRGRKIHRHAGLVADGSLGARPAGPADDARHADAALERRAFEARQPPVLPLRVAPLSLGKITR